MSDVFEIQSYAGPYSVNFVDDVAAQLSARADRIQHVIIDRQVAELHRKMLEPILANSSVLTVEATERNKSLERIPEYIAHLISHGIRRDHCLMAIGGGIIQDITCFVAANLLRGLDWVMVPTTLLAQADSCIGSKSSINCGGAKNILGTFTPPKQVWISTRFLETLAEQDLRSGIGEMLKVHAIEGPQAFDRIAADYQRILSDRIVMREYIQRSLLIKRRFIEVDEFDRGVRSLFNFGHTFGHALEAATDFSVPHGIAVTIGMDIALEIAHSLELTKIETVSRMRPILRRNANGHRGVSVPISQFMNALAKDKKNTGSGTVTAILPIQEGRIEKVTLAMNRELQDICETFFRGGDE